MVAVFCIIMITVIETVSGTSKIIQGKLPWKMANSQCLSMRGALADPNDTYCKQFPSHTHTVWFRGYQTYIWLKPLGCILYSRVQRSRESYAKNFDECISSCNTSYILYTEITGPRCYCSNIEPSNTYSCNIEYGQTGTKVYSVLDLNNLNTDNNDCVLVKCINSTLNTLMPAYCGRKYRAFCYGRGNATVNQGKGGTQNEMVQKCTHDFLSFVTSDDICKFAIGSQALFWTGIRRYTKWHYENPKDNGSKHILAKCTVGTCYQETQKMQKSTENCSISLDGYACLLPVNISVYTSEHSYKSTSFQPSENFHEIRSTFLSTSNGSITSFRPEVSIKVEEHVNTKDSNLGLVGGVTAAVICLCLAGGTVIYIIRRRIFAEDDKKATRTHISCTYNDTDVGPLQSSTNVLNNEMYGIANNNGLIFGSETTSDEPVHQDISSSAYAIVNEQNKSRDVTSRENKFTLNVSNEDEYNRLVHVTNIRKITTDPNVYDTMSGVRLDDDPTYNIASREDFTKQNMNDLYSFET